MKAPLGFFADFLESGAQSAIPSYEVPPKAARRRTREQDELILWFYEVAMTSGLPASDRTNDITNYQLDVLFGVKTLDGLLATRVSGT